MDSETISTNELDVRYVAVPRETMKTVDRIIKLAKGRPTIVDGEKD